MDDIRAEYLTLVLGYVMRQGETMSEVYTRLRRQQPELFPSPRGRETINDAMREAVRKVRGF